MQVTVNVSSVVTTDGAFLNEDGWVSEDTMKVQDSLKFQDYSYIIREIDQLMNGEIVILKHFTLLVFIFKVRLQLKHL